MFLKWEETTFRRNVRQKVEASFHLRGPGFISDGQLKTTKGPKALAHPPVFMGLSPVIP